MRERSSGHLSVVPAGGRLGGPVGIAARYVRKSPPSPSSSPGAPSPTLRLVFQLPPALGLLAPGRHQPSSAGCVLEIGPGGLVAVTGRSRREIFEHVKRFLGVVAKNKPACALAAVLQSPPGYWHGHGGRDGWTIIVNAEIAFAPSGCGVELLEPERGLAGA